MKQKFQILDEVYVILNHEIVKKTIVGCCYVKLLNEIDYSFYLNDKGEFDMWINQKYLFKTKEELIESLK